MSATAAPDAHVATDRDIAPMSRVTLSGAHTDRLYFAQVREDPRLEIQALIRPDGSNRIAVVASGGCTALSLLAAGATEILCIDLNTTQNHLVDLKLAAVTALGARDAIVFLGNSAGPPERRLHTYGELRPLLSPAARDYWDRHPDAIASGVNASGVTERFLAIVAYALRHLVIGGRRVDRLLQCDDVSEQRALFEREWRGWRWSALFALLCNRAAIRRTYDPSFFRNASRGSFAAHFRELAERTLTELPLADNYFVHDILGGGYPMDVENGVPPYLSGAGARIVRGARDRITLVDGVMTDCLRARPAGSIDGFALSNIGEWLDDAAVDSLFAEVARTAAPGARLVFRNFVGWTEVPERWRHVVIEDREAGDALIRRDRSGVQRRIAICRIQKESLR
ncbi:MAG: BtaA family protein [Gemmatimonadota bacterium]|nr:BtaA family protein [Gemmatimonadota bacterium]